MKKIIILGGGLLSRGVYIKLFTGGFYTICLDKNSNAPCKDIADEFHQVDISNTQLVEEIATRQDADGIMPINEFGTYTAAKVAQLLNLHGNSVDVVLRANSKIKMRKRWMLSELSQPRYYPFTDYKEMQWAIEYVGFPAVIKPDISGGGGRGVSIVKNKRDLSLAYARARQYALTLSLVADEYISGTELTVETFSNNGKVHVLAISEKIKPVGTTVATRLTYPANLTRGVRDDIKNLVISAVESLGIRTGMAHTEVIVSNKNGIPYLVETGARGGGGHIFHTIIEETSGFNAVVQTARVLTGLPISVGEVSHRGAVYGFFTVPRGVLTSVENLEEAKKKEGVIDIGLLKNIGDRVGSFENSLERCGYFVTSGETRKDATAIADWVENTVKFDVIGD